MCSSILVLVGPTAVGKTAVALELGPLLAGEIVSADSVAVYRGLDIGSAKPSLLERSACIFHLIDVCDPRDNFSAGDFQRLSQSAIRDIICRGKSAIVTGGSGLYVRAAVDGLMMSLPGENPELRKRLYDIADRRGNLDVHRLLQRIDPASALNMPAGNLKRVIRAIEICAGSGRKASELFEEDSGRPSTFPEAVFFGLTLPRETLYERIDRRVEAMMEQGLLQEVKELIESGVPKDALSMQSVGYKEIISHLFGEITLQEAVETIKKNTRRFAKRQYTWFNADKRIKWIEMQSLNAGQAAVMIKESLQQ